MAATAEFPSTVPSAIAPAFTDFSSPVNANPISKPLFGTVPTAVKSSLEFPAKIVQPVYVVAPFQLAYSVAPFVSHKIAIFGGAAG